jgi:FMN phosphatase YigB (HAD superfamily)
VTAPAVEAITFDFGNTLVPVARDDLHRVVEVTATDVIERSGPFERATFLATWAEERERQFAEEVPLGREVDVDQRVIRVLARLRGMPAPPATDRWDDTAAAAFSDESERSAAVDAYSRAFVSVIPVPDGVGRLLEHLAATRILGVLSNWPLAGTIDAYLAAAGWSGYFRAVVVSQRVGSIKPSPEIFRAAEAALGVEGAAILHVGDDWAADIVGAKRAGWLAAYLRDSQGDTPLPMSDRDDAVRPDLELDRLVDLPAALGRFGAAGG